MNEEDSINKIKSIYNKKSKLLLSFQKNKSTKNYITFNPITNNKRNNKLINLNKKFVNRPKSTINKINEFFKSDVNKLSININKNTIEQELYNGKNFQNYFIKKNKIIYLLRKVFIILPNDKNQMYTKYYPTDLFFNFYFPIRIFNSQINTDYINNPTKDDIICDDLNHILHEVYKYLKLSIYDSVKMEIYDEKFHSIVKESQLFINTKRIIYVKISYLKEKQVISWKKKIESKLFPIDDNYLIKTENRLINNKIPSLYKDVSTEYNHNDIRIITTYKNKSLLKNMLGKKINLTENNFNVDTKNLYNKTITNPNTNNNTINNTIMKTNYKTFSNESEKNKYELNPDYYNYLDENDNYEEEIISNIFVSADENNFLSLKKSRKSLSLFSKNLIKRVLNTENKGTQGKLNFSFNEKENNSNSINYYSSTSKTNKMNNGNNNSQQNKNNIKDLKEIKNIKEVKKIKIGKKFKHKSNKNVLYNLIKKNRIGKIKNNLLSPLLFNFDVNDIINNKYVLKYLTNKNKENLEKDIIQIKSSIFKIKNLNEDDSTSHRKKIFGIKTNMKLAKKDINYNLNEEEENEEVKIKMYTEKNRKKYCNLNMKMKEFIINEIDNLFTNEETEDFKSLNCNYILINELKNFPVYKLKKEFLFYTCLSFRIKLKYGDLLNKIKDILLNNNNNENYIKEIFLLDDMDNCLNYLDEIFTKLINNKMYLFRYIGSSQKDIRIDYIFFILFMIYNGNLLEKKVDKKLIFLSLECIDISFNKEINFQQYCNYKLVMNKNIYIIYNKKFNFIKDFIIRVLVNERFNKKNFIEKLTKIFDININDIKNIFKFDMCSIKLKQNIDVYKKVEKLYEDFLNYYSFSISEN